MEKSLHDLQELFAQLGLPNSEMAIRQFCAEHFLRDSERLADAKFWTQAQAQFLREGLLEDADWAELIDRLDANLRH